MSLSAVELPSFVQEALEDGYEIDEAAVNGLGALPALVAPAPVTRGRGRLLATVEALPWRYAPFFDRLASLWDLSQAEVEAALERARKPEAWRKPGLPGLRVIDIAGGPRVREADVTLVRFAPGLRFPAHLHAGPEAVFVLEGSYEDESGRVVGPGDLHEMASGTRHFFRIDRREPCIAASVQFGMEFTGAFMRLMTKLFG